MPPEGRLEDHPQEDSRQIEEAVQTHVSANIRTTYTYIIELYLAESYQVLAFHFFLP